MNNPDPSMMITALRRQMDERRRIDTNIHNLAKSIFKVGVKVIYQLRGRDYFGYVVEVSGEPGATHVVLKNVNGVKSKQRKLNLADIVGFAQEI
jgi:hypothetical protein